MGTGKTNSSLCECWELKLGPLQEVHQVSYPTPTRRPRKWEGPKGQEEAGTAKLAEGTDGKGSFLANTVSFLCAVFALSLIQKHWPSV